MKEGGHVNVIGGGTCRRGEMGDTSANVEKGVPVDGRRQRTVRGVVPRNRVTCDHGRGRFTGFVDGDVTRLNAEICGFVGGSGRCRCARRGIGGCGVAGGFAHCRHGGERLVGTVRVGVNHVWHEWRRWMKVECQCTMVH